MRGDAEAGLVSQNKLWPAHVQMSLLESGDSGGGALAFCSLGIACTSCCRNACEPRG